MSKGISTVLTTMIILVASVVLGTAVIIYGTSLFQSQTNSTQLQNGPLNETTVIISNQISNTYWDSFKVMLNGTLISYSVTNDLSDQPVIRLKISTDNGIKNLIFQTSADLSTGAYSIIADERYFHVGDRIILVNLVDVYSGCGNVLLQYHDGTTATYNPKNFTLESVPAYKNYHFIDERTNPCKPREVHVGYELNDHTQLMQWAAHYIQLSNETGVTK